MRRIPRRNATEGLMLTLIAAIALAVGLASPHAHTGTVLGTHPHVTSTDTNGGGPPTRP
jgi:hypothetical protein